MEKLVTTVELSHRMTTMSAICAIMIVAIHCTPIPPAGIWQWWVANMLGADGLCRIAVPWFFVASGFFLAGRWGEIGWYSQSVRKRIRTLLVPFVIWAVVGLIFNWGLWYGIQITGYACGVRNPMGDGVLMGLIRAFGFDTDRMNIGPIWYLRMLFLLVIISPIVCWCIRRLGLLLPAVLFVIYGVYNSAIHFSDFWEYVFSLRGLCYFTIGIAVRLGALRCFSKCISPCGAIIMLAIGIAALGTNTVSRANGLVLLENIADLIMPIPLICGMWVIVANVRLPSCLVENYFPLYVLHGFVIKLSIIFIVLLGYRPQMDISISLSLLRIASAVVASIVFAMLLRRCFPKLATLVFGGR